MTARRFNETRAWLALFAAASRPAAAAPGTRRAELLSVAYSLAKINCRRLARLRDAETPLAVGHDLHVALAAHGFTRLECERIAVDAYQAGKQATK